MLEDRSCRCGNVMYQPGVGCCVLLRAESQIEGAGVREAELREDAQLYEVRSQLSLR